jgi:hypothetical protein
MKKEVKIPLYASIDDDVYEVIGVNNVEEIVKVKNFESGDSFTMPINKWIIESFKLGTPTTFDYKGNKISGEIIMKNGVKSISLYPDENYGGAIQRIIPLNLIDVTTSSSLMNKELFKDGGNISSDNQEKIEKLQKVVNSNLIPENIKEKARLEIEALKSKSESKIVSKINPTYIKEITTRTGTNPVAVEKFFSDNNLGDNEALGLVTGLGRKQIEPLDFVTAIIGKDGNQYAINIVKFLKNNESFKSAEETQTVGEIDYEQRQLNKKVYALLDKKLSGKADIGFKLRIVQVIGAALEDANYHSANYDFAKAIDSSITTKEEWYRSKIANPSKEDGSLGREISNLCSFDGEKIVACFDFALKMFGMPKIADVLNKVMTADEEQQEEDEDTITNTYKGLIYKVSKDTYETDDYSSNYVSKYYFSVFEPNTNYTLNYSSNYNSNVEAIASARKFIDSIKINGFYPKALIPTVSITDRNGTFKLPFNTVSDAKEFTLAMISHGFEYSGKPIEEELVKSEPKKDVSTVEIKDSRIGDKNISEISTYIPNREILSVKVKHNGKEIEIKGTDIFDGIYVDDKIIPSTRKPKAEPKMSRTQFEEETFEFEKGGRVLNDYVYKEVFDYIIGGNRPSSIEILKNQVNTKAKKLNASVSELYEEVKDAESSSYDYMEKGGKVSNYKSNALAELKSWKKEKIEDIKFVAKLLGITPQNREYIEVSNKLDYLVEDITKIIKSGILKDGKYSYWKTFDVKSYKGNMYVDANVALEKDIAYEHPKFEKDFEEFNKKFPYSTKNSFSKEFIGRLTIPILGYKLCDYTTLGFERVRSVGGARNNSFEKGGEINSNKDIWNYDIEYLTSKKVYFDINTGKVYPKKDLKPDMSKGKSIDEFNDTWFEDLSDDDLGTIINYLNDRKLNKGGKVISKELEKIIDTTRSFFESNGVNYGQTDDLGNEIIIEPSTVLPKDSNLPKGSLDGMQIIYDKRTKIYEVSEYQAGPDEKDLYIFGEYKSLIPALKSLIKGNSTTGRKPMKIEKFAKGGYVRPAYNMPIVGDYSFKTKDGLGYEFRVTGFERAGDDTDSLYFDDSETTAKKELGTIIIKNSSWKNLANGKTIMAVSEKGVNGKLTKIK